MPKIRKNYFHGVYIILGSRKSGKTALCVKTTIVNHTLGYLRYVHSNFKINVPYNRYSKYLFLPYSKIDNDGLIVDDIGAYEIISRRLPEKLFIEIMNTSDKMSNLIMLTGQDHVYFPPIIRRNAQIWKLERNNKFPIYIDGLGLLISAIQYKEEFIGKGISKLTEIGREKFIIEDKYLNMYETTETVNTVTTLEIFEELPKIVSDTTGYYSRKDKLKFIDYFLTKDKDKKEMLSLMEETTND